MSEKKKMGRPTDSVKAHEVKTRINKETYDILMKYCKKFNKNRAEALRESICKLEDEL